MDYGRLIVDAWNITRSHRFLWGLGLLVTIGGVVWSFVSRLLFSLAFRPQAGSSDPLAPFARLIDLFNSGRFVTALMAAGLVFFVASLLFWLVSATAEGGLIRAVTRLGKGETVGGRQAWTAGVGLLGRFVALDTLLFFPLFIVLLIVIVGETAVFVAFILTISQGASFGEVLFPFFLAGGCVAFLGMLALPVTAITLVFRHLSLRATAVQGLGVRLAIRHTIALLRRDWGQVLIVMIFTWFLRYFLGFALGMVLLPLSMFDFIPQVLALSGEPRPVLLPLAVGVALLTTLLVAAFNAILHAYISTLWTLAYREWIATVPVAANG